MQTFLPYHSFIESAHVLDDKRLGKQRVECLQILQTLAKGPTEVVQKPDASGTIAVHRKTPWYNHPAVRMWKGHESLLCVYALAMCNEWKHRSYKDTCSEKIMQSPFAAGACSYPVWLGNPDFHAAHRSNLLRKNPTHYSNFGWTEPHNLPYIWPV